jgi:hypothetical protein
MCPLPWSGRTRPSQARRPALPATAVGQRGRTGSWARARQLPRQAHRSRASSPPARITGDERGHPSIRPPQPRVASSAEGSTGRPETRGRSTPCKNDQGTVSGTTSLTDRRCASASSFAAGSCTGTRPRDHVSSATVPSLRITGRTGSNRRGPLTTYRCRMGIRTPACLVWCGVARGPQVVLPGHPPWA